MIGQLSRPVIDGTHEQMCVIIRRNEEGDPGQVAVRVYPTAFQNDLTDEQVAAISRGYLITGTPEEIESKADELSKYSDTITDGANQLAEIQAEIEKAKKPKAKATTKAKAKPKAKTNAEKVADQRKKQIEESQKKAKENLQASLDLDRLGDEKEKKAEPNLEDIDV